MNAQQAYALRADAVYLLRGMGYSYKELAAIFRTTREPIRKLEARGQRLFREARRQAALPNDKAQTRST
jgi:hypothetical protein